MGVCSDPSSSGGLLGSSLCQSTLDDVHIPCKSFTGNLQKQQPELRVQVLGSGSVVNSTHNMLAVLHLNSRQCRPAKPALCLAMQYSSCAQSLVDQQITVKGSHDKIASGSG